MNFNQVFNEFFFFFFNFKFIKLMKKVVINNFSIHKKKYNLAKKMK